MRSNYINILVYMIILLTFSFIFAGNADKVSDFTLKDYDGESYTLSKNTGSKAVVIMFIGTRCPVSNDYNERMARLHEDYLSKGISFIAINSNKQEDADEVKEHAEEHGFKFRVLKDPGNKVADAYDAQVTPEIYVINPNMELLYHGRIDDSRREGDVESNDLRKALDQILADEPVSLSETKAFGCSIKRVN